MYALVEIAGKQYKAEPDAVLKVDHLGSEEGASVEFDSVLLVSTDKGVTVGAPYVKGAKVTAEVAGHDRDSKITVFKHKRRKNYRRTRGHRQHYTTLKVKGISGV